jgi:hypothetical protein
MISRTYRRRFSEVGYLDRAHPAVSGRGDRARRQRRGPSVEKIGDVRPHRRFDG